MGKDEIGQLEAIRKNICDGLERSLDHRMYANTLDLDLLRAIKDNLETGEASLISPDESNVYLKIYKDDGLRKLNRLTSLNFNGCQAGTRLFTDEMIKDIERLFAKLSKGEEINYNYGLDFQANEGSSGIVDERIVNNLSDNLKMLPVSYYNEVSISAAKWEISLDYMQFKTPRDLFPSNASETIAGIWVSASRNVLQEAWVRMLTPKLVSPHNYFSAYIDELGRKYSQFGIRLTKSYMPGMPDIVVEYNAGRSNMSFEEIRDKFHELFAEIQLKLSGEIAGLMSDRKFWRSVLTATALVETESREDPIASSSRYVEENLRLVEAPKRTQFIDMLNAMIKEYAKVDRDFTDLDAAVLRGDDVALGYEGYYQYEPHGKSRAYVPLADHATMVFYKPEEVLQILSAIMVMHKGKKTGKKIPPEESVKYLATLLGMAELYNRLDRLLAND